MARHGAFCWLHTWVESAARIDGFTHRVCVVCRKHQVLTDDFSSVWTNYATWKRGQELLKELTNGKA